MKETGVAAIIRKAVFPAAGLGTRFLPATKAQPKEMLPLVDKPIIQYGVEEAVASGVDDIILATDVIDAQPPALAQMIEVFNKVGGPVIAVERVPERDLPSYGVIAAEPAGPGVYKILDLVEKPPAGQAPSDLAIIGRYVLTPDIFPMLEETARERG